MAENKTISSKSHHDLNLLSREKLSINGITEIINFDDNEINLKTICGDLTIDGTELKIDILNVANGQIELKGKINGINYSNIAESNKHSLLSKIFK